MECEPTRFLLIPDPYTILSSMLRFQTRPPGAEALGRLPKSDAPEKFWAIVEPYCADISQEDMKVFKYV